MKVKLLRKVRKYAAWLIDSKLTGFGTTNGKVTSITYSCEYGWAFEALMGESIDCEDRAKLVSIVSREVWKHHKFERWMAKSRKSKKGEVAE